MHEEGKESCSTFGSAEVPRVGRRGQRLSPFDGDEAVIVNCSLLVTIVL